MRQILQVLGGIVILPFAILLGVFAQIVNAILAKKPAYLTVFEEQWAGLNFYEDHQTWERSRDGVPQYVIDLYAVHWAHAEIANGGFWQFFFNSTGLIAPEARDGFAAIGMQDASRAIDDAMARLGQPYPLDRDARMRVVGEPDGDCMEFEPEESAFVAAVCNPKMFGGAPLYYRYADAYAERMHQ